MRSAYFFSCEFYQIVSFEDLVHFIQIIEFVVINLFIIFLYYPFNSMESAVMSPLSFLVLVICVFFLSFLA